MSHQEDQSKSSYFSLSGETLRSVSNVEPNRLRLHKAGVVLDKKYEVIGLLGEGGMGAVYRVRHLMLNKEVALKTFRSDHFTAEDNIRFQREAQAIARLNHVNIVQVFDFGMTEEGIPYYTMEYLQGQALSEIINQSGALSVADTLTVFLQVAQGLSLAHSKGIIHRDLKPANIFIESKKGVEDGRLAGRGIKIMDFGIASLTQQTEEDLKLTEVGMIFGSPLYMSPEQSSGLAVNQKSDIYSLGCALFETLTGETPFHGATAIETIMLHHNGNPPTLSDVVAGSRAVNFSASLERLVATMLRRDPADRQSSMVQVAAEIADLKAEPAAARSNRPQQSSRLGYSNEREGESDDDYDVSGGSSFDIWQSPLWVKCLAGMLVVAGIGAAYYLWKQMGGVATKPKVVSKLSAGPGDAGEMLKVPQSMRVNLDVQPLRARPRFRTHIDKNGHRWFELLYPEGTKAGMVKNGDRTLRFDSDGTNRLYWDFDATPVFFPSPAFLANPQNFQELPENSLRGLYLVNLCKAEDLPLLYKGILRQSANLNVFTVVDEDADATLMPVLNQLPHLYALSVNKTRIRGSELAHYSALHKIEALSFCVGLDVTGLIDGLKGSQLLETLTIPETALSPADVQKLVAFPRLKILDIASTGQTDASIRPLINCKRLEWLQLTRNKITPASLELLKALGRKGLNTLIIDEKGWSDSDKAELRAAIKTVQFGDVTRQRAEFAVNDDFQNFLNH